MEVDIKIVPSATDLVHKKDSSVWVVVRQDWMDHHSLDIKTLTAAAVNAKCCLCPTAQELAADKWEDVTCRVCGKVLNIQESEVPPIHVPTGMRVVALSVRPLCSSTMTHHKSPLVLVIDTLPGPPVVSPPISIISKPRKKSPKLSAVGSPLVESTPLLRTVSVPQQDPGSALSPPVRVASTIPVSASNSLSSVCSGALSPSASSSCQASEASPVFPGSGGHYCRPAVLIRTFSCKLTPYQLSVVQDQFVSQLQQQSGFISAVFDSQEHGRMISVTTYGSPEAAIQGEAFEDRLLSILSESGYLNLELRATNWEA